jgi:putative membrane protein insertion efficiency factor
MRFRLIRQWPRRALVGLVKGYRFFLSPWLGSSCRFEPTCSAYALRALEHHGAAVGSCLTVNRLLRCHPWCAGGHDPVPAQGQGLFTRWLVRQNRSQVTDVVSAPSSSSLEKISP